MMLKARSRYSCSYLCICIMLGTTSFSMFSCLLSILSLCVSVSSEAHLRPGLLSAQATVPTA